MVIHLKQNYISHLPPGLHDGWQGPQPKHRGLIAPLFSVTNVTRKTYGTFRYPTVLNENVFVIRKVRQKIHMVLAYPEFFTWILLKYSSWLIGLSVEGGDGHAVTICVCIFVQNFQVNCNPAWKCQWHCERFLGNTSYRQSWLCDWFRLLCFSMQPLNLSLTIKTVALQAWQRELVKRGGPEGF